MSLSEGGFGVHIYVSITIYPLYHLDPLLQIHSGNSFSIVLSKHLFLWKTKMKVIGMNHSPCSCTWSWRCNWYSSSLFSIIQSRVSPPQAASQLVLWLIWWHTLDSHLWGIWAPGHHALIRRGMLHLSIHHHSGAGTVDTQVESLGCHTLPLFSWASSADQSQLLCQDGDFTCCLWSLKTGNPKCPDRSHRI